jgi:hypothetical protein
MKIKAFLEDNKWLVALLIATLAGILIYRFFIWPTPGSRDPKVLAEFHWTSKVVLILVAILAGWFLDIFTGDATKRKVGQMVAFCYVFPFALFVGVLFPLFAFPEGLPDPPKPIGLIMGCSETPKNAENKDAIPAGIRCDNHTDQWLVNIGGRAVPAEEHRPPATPPEDSTAASNATPASNTAPVPATAASAIPPHERRFVIEGGLVIPLYFVILAIFGGFVSMLRRVPEYQERVSHGASDPLSFERTREKLVFEVLQILSAPLIAITAYYLVDPTSRATSIALAFIAGFSSETVLLYIRALAEKLQPQTIRRRAPEVEVSPASLDFKTASVGSESAPQPVTLVNGSAVALTGTATISGEFDGVPQGAFTVAPGSRITFSVAFKPSTPGAKEGQLRLEDNGSGSPRVVQLSGTGQ